MCQLMFYSSGKIGKGIAGAVFSNTPTRSLGPAPLFPAAHALGLLHVGLRHSFQSITKRWIPQLSQCTTWLRPFGHVSTYLTEELYCLSDCMDAHKSPSEAALGVEPASAIRTSDLSFRIGRLIQYFSSPRLRPGEMVMHRS
jgi:hypothetical protein